MILRAFRSITLISNFEQNLYRQSLIFSSIDFLMLKWQEMKTHGFDLSLDSFKNDEKYDLHLELVAYCS